jgi:predicted methyltransferase
MIRSLCSVGRSVGAFAAALIVACGLALMPSAVTAASDAERLQQLIDGPQRSAENRARDRYRNPLPVLSFLKVTPTSRVVEVLPGTAGFWTEILAPYLKDGGHYTAAIPKANPERPEIMKAIADIKAKYAADPTSYGRVDTVDFSSAEPQFGAPGSADFVLTFRNLHNWMAAGKAEAVIAAVYAVLRPGGILGIEEHRGRADQPQDPLAKTGYVREDYTIALIEKAGFKLVAKSEVNANPKDTKDYPSGVWTLPPTYRMKDQDRDKYTAIGESDRYLMMFVKQ